MVLHTIPKYHIGLCVPIVRILLGFEHGAGIRKKTLAHGTGDFLDLAFLAVHGNDLVAVAVFLISLGAQGTTAITYTDVKKLFCHISLVFVC